MKLEYDFLKNFFLKSKKILITYLGWKGSGGGFSAWDGGEEVCISLDCNPKKRRPTKKQLLEIRALFNADVCNYFGSDGGNKPYIVISWKKEEEGENGRENA